MTQNEIITIGISTGALVVSLVTLYLTFFYKRTGLVGVLVICNYSAPGKYDIELEYILSNVGNIQLLLKDVELLTGRDSYGKRTSAYGVPRSDCPEVPTVIEPGQVKLIRVHFVHGEIEKAKENKERCFITFTIISSRARTYAIMHDVTAIGEHKTEAERLVWKPFRMSKKHK